MTSQYRIGPSRNGMWIIEKKSKYGGWDEVLEDVDIFDIFLDPPVRLFSTKESARRYAERLAKDDEHMNTDPEYL